jgi:hypothetical protein
MARKPADAKFIADQEERAARAAEKRAAHEQDAMEWERLGLKGRGVSLDQYKKIQDYRRKQAADEERITNENKEQARQGKKTRDLARDHGKFLKSNSGQLLSSLGIMDESNVLAKKAKDAEIEANKMRGKGKGIMEKRFRSEQQGYNVAAQARKDAMLEIEQGTFDEISFGDNLASELDQIPGMTKKARNEILQEGLDWAKATNEIIESAGGGEDFAKKMEMSKESLSAIDGFEEKIFKIKSFITDPQFRSILMKGFFIGLATAAAAKLGEFIKGTIDLVTELGVSFKSLPLAASLAADETKAMLNEFGSLNEVTSKQLLLMKLRSKIFGVEAADQAKILKLQTSITDQTKDMALKDQAMFMKDIRKQGLSVSKVMGDIASNADMFANFAKDGGKNMEEAAAAAAKMGLNLEATNSVAEKLLDFESSIQAEQEASMLLGRSINLDKARQLAVSGDLKQMMEEVKRQAGGEAEFAKLNVVQRQALGEAIGLQGEQLATLLKDQEASTKEQEKGYKAVLMGVAAGALLGAVLGAAAVGFGGALWGGLTFGLAAKAAIKGGMKGLGQGMLAGAGKGGLIGAGIGGAGGLGVAAFQGREQGGPVRAGNPYIVGEKRPELFIPTQSGHILPNVPKMEQGTGFVQGDMSETNELLKGLMAQNEKLHRDANRKRESAFANR